MRAPDDTLVVPPDDTLVVPPDDTLVVHMLLLTVTRQSLYDKHQFEFCVARMDSITYSVTYTAALVFDSMIALLKSASPYAFMCLKSDVK